jgi:subtilisin family serine protease
MANDERAGFRPKDLYRSVIAAPLLERFDGPSGDAAPAGPADVHRVVIDLHLGYPEGREAAAKRVKELVDQIVAGPPARPGEGVDEDRTRPIVQYVVARLSSDSLRELVRLDRDAGLTGGGSAIYRIWPDFPVRPLINRSCATVKADAAHTAFAATGADVVWAVVDSGIQGDHPHFATHDNLAVTAPVDHKDFTGGKSPLTDAFGHGTHVAGILAGELRAKPAEPGQPAETLGVVRAEVDERGDVSYVPQPVAAMAGMAPACRLVSYKVLDDSGNGETSAIIAALQEIQRVNNNGRDIKIHGVNLSVGYEFDPLWFACGESPLCVEVSRLVKSGVVIVVAAGNTGYGYAQDRFKGNVAAGMALTINDPGNAELAITVGSTHRDMPHRYGVSYFSSKGPTGDGRAKPDMVAPGERILSCASGTTLADVLAKPGVVGPIDYVEDSGTSMAAAHVSGVIAAFLSIRPEYIGRAEDVKRIFTSTATDLGRMPHFQGAGLVDLMRAIQSV